MCSIRVPNTQKGHKRHQVPLELEIPVVSMWVLGMEFESPARAVRVLSSGHLYSLPTPDTLILFLRNLHSQTHSHIQIYI